MSDELAYSIHLGSDKNKIAKAKEIDDEYRNTLINLTKYHVIMY